jgi:hypothetical protein
MRGDRLMREFLVPIDVSGSIATSPSPPGVRIGRKTLAGADMLAFRTAQGIERLVMPHLSRAGFAGIVGTAANAFAFHGVISGQFSATGTLTARPAASGNMAVRAKRTGIVSAATAGALAGFHQTNALWTIGTGTGLGGFFAVFRFVVSDVAPVVGARMFVGLSSTITTPTNTEPSALTNQIGVAQISTSANLQIVFGGTIVQAPIDLGINFPAGSQSTDFYELILFSDANDASKIGYRLERLNTGDVATGAVLNTIPGTTLPAANTMLALRHWRSNNTTALAVGIDVASTSVVSDF